MGTVQRLSQSNCRGVVASRTSVRSRFPSFTHHRYTSEQLQLGHVPQVLWRATAADRREKTGFVARDRGSVDWYA